MTGVAKNTILKLRIDVGSACMDFQDRMLRNLNRKGPGRKPQKKSGNR
jgi:hypothetical protein